MQVKMKRSEFQRGLVFKKTYYKVFSHLICNEEERMAFKTLNQDNKQVFDSTWSVDKKEQGEVSGRMWVDGGFTVWALDIPEAVRIESHIKEQAIHVKQAVEEFVATGGKTETEEVLEL